MRTRTSGTCCFVSRRSIQLLVILLASLAGPTSPAQTGQTDLRFRPAAGGGFQFDTGVLRGVLLASGNSVGEISLVSGGLTSLVHVPSGKPISAKLGLFGYYRVFTSNHRYFPDAWSAPSQAKLSADGSVEVHWSATDGRPFEMWAVYRWAAADTLDVETRVRPHADLTGFESFLASYFAEQFNSSMVCVKKRTPVFVAAEESNGKWQMFPRDEAAIRLIEDGRWEIPPNPPGWRIMQKLAKPLAIRRDLESGITALVMAPPGDCIAVSTPQQTDAHHSLYLSLFGRNIKAGETARVRARLVIGTRIDDTEALNLYKAYMDSLRKRRVTQRSAARP